jgi:type II secretory pathway pseudopilin PulG
MTWLHRREMQTEVNWGKISLGTVVLAIVLIAALFGLGFACKAYNRYQRRADAHNQIQVTKQQLKVAQQQKLIKKTIAEGQKLANEQIAKRLTPLFVQYEMIQALEDIAQSGRNNSVVFIPSGANGIPLVSVSNQPQVYGGQLTPSK